MLENLFESLGKLPEVSKEKFIKIEKKKILDGANNFDDLIFLHF